MPRKGLDILGQKSWHVLRRHNVERVLKDEREERERKQKETDREQRAEAEARLNTLRAKSGNATKDELPTESINFFKVDDLKELKNHDKEREDIAEEDVQARKDGLLNYVGETVLENGDPWYAQRRDAPKAESELVKEKFLKDEQRKLKEDPFEAKFKSLNRTAETKKKKPDEQLILIYDKYYDEGKVGIFNY